MLVFLSNFPIHCQSAKKNTAENREISLGKKRQRSRKRFRPTFPKSLGIFSEAERRANASPACRGTTYIFGVRGREKAQLPGGGGVFGILRNGAGQFLYTPCRVIYSFGRRASVHIPERAHL